MAAWKEVSAKEVKLAWLMPVSHSVASDISAPRSSESRYGNATRKTAPDRTVRN